MTCLTRNRKFMKLTGEEVFMRFELLYTRIRRRYNKDEVLTKGSDHARVHAPPAVSTSKLMLSNSRRLYDEFIYRNRNRTSINTDTILHTIVY